MRNIYCFGNELIEGDEVAYDIGKLLDLNEFEIVHAMSPNEILNAQGDIIILDVAKGINKVSLINDIDKLELVNSITCHDMDLAFHLKLMRTTGKIQSVNIIAIPYGTNKKDYNIVKNKVERILKEI